MSFRLGLAVRNLHKNKVLSESGFDFAQPSGVESFDFVQLVWLGHD